MSWSRYYEVHRSRPPRQLLLDVLDCAGPGEGRQALDLGAGTGRETLALLEAGWRVLAVDAEQAAIDIIRGDAAVYGDRLETAVGSYDEVALPPAELVHASYSLPFVAADRFQAAWSRVLAALEPGGWLLVDLFGVEDSWNDGSGALTFHTREQVLALLAGLEVEQLDEEERDGEAVSGPKHWHAFHVVARRR
jgi:trans-aconitate methyltransferase